MGMAKEFKEFAMRGNVVDMAIGIVIGASFGKIVTSLVADVITPPLGLVIGGVDFSKLALKLGNPLNGMVEVTINYGKFIQSLFDFIIVAFALFLVIKGMNALQKKKVEAPAGPPPPTTTEKLLTEIRDSLKTGR